MDWLLQPRFTKRRFHGIIVFIALGSYCDTEELASPAGLCSAGYYCTLGAVRPDPQEDSTGGSCTQGHYCPEGTGSPEPCPPGYYSNTTGNTNFTDCRLCTAGKHCKIQCRSRTLHLELRFKLSYRPSFDVTAIDVITGYYCDSYGMSEPRGPCDQGYYCPEGQNVSSPDAYICTPGHYCPTGSANLVACDPGTYQDLFGQVCSNLNHSTKMVFFMQRHILKYLLSFHFIVFSGRARPALLVSIVIRRCRMIRSVRMAYRIHNPVQQGITVQMARNMA